MSATPHLPARWGQPFHEAAVHIISDYRDVPLTAEFVAVQGSYQWTHEDVEPDASAL